jgi:L-2,4-diaminobutyrate decarboxylase
MPVMQNKHPNALINEMFNAEHFRETGHALIDMLSQHLADNTDAKRLVVNWQEPVAEDSHWQAAIPTSARLDRATLLQTLEKQILANSLAIHHPRNMGHQVATPLPIAALCDLVASLTNQAMTIYEVGPSATMLERQVVRWLCNLIDDTNTASGGVLTSGGAMANLTALLAARQIAASQIDSKINNKEKWNAWKTGLNGQARLCILASEHAHYSIARAAGIMGLGSDAVIKVATDSEGRMDTAALKLAHQHCQESDLHIIAVVASAGCTPTGIIDSLQAIGEFCQAHHLWFHVDGAHGASALLSEQHRKKLKGIELADSVIWDGHKLLYMPATVSAVLFKNAAHADAAFAQEASYLFQEEDEAQEERTKTTKPEAFNISYRTLECTKRMMALKLWVAFSLYGTHGLGALVDEAFSKAQLFAEKIKQHPSFELRLHPQTNIVCFRHQAPNLRASELNQHQTNIRKKLVESGAFHLTQVELHGNIWLRTTLMNPFTTETDLDALLSAISN